MQGKITVTIEKLVFGGQGLVRLEDGPVLFVWNALPGERVEVEILKKKKDYWEGVAVNILEASPERIKEKESIFLSTSPWQICTFESENTYKQELAQEIYERTGGLTFEEPIPIVFTEEEFGYRNKMEFSFVLSENGEISLAFFERGRNKKVSVDGSLLAEPIINTVACRILEWIKKTGMTTYNLKSLIIRSDGNAHAIAALFIKDELFFDDYPQLDEQFLGFQFYYSTHKSPASVPTKLLYTSGHDYLVARLNERELKFGLLSFFQVNIPIFSLALSEMALFLDKKKPFVDFYSGVGAIGLALHGGYSEAYLVDNNTEAIDYAKENILLNNFENVEAQCIPTEKITELITKDKQIIFDPPRAGLHQNVIDKLLEEQPSTLIYMSCNLSTHARDIALLESVYTVTSLKLFNFFPRTPHVEAIAILQKK